MKQHPAPCRAKARELGLEGNDDGEGRPAKGTKDRKNEKQKRKRAEDAAAEKQRKRNKLVEVNLLDIACMRTSLPAVGALYMLR